MFSAKQGGASKEDFLKKAKEERETRVVEKKRTAAAAKIQRWMRNVTGRRKIRRQQRLEIDQCLTEAEKSPKPAIDVFLAGQKLLFVFDPIEDNERLNSFCQATLASMESSEVKVWYISVSLNMTHAVAWIRQMKQLLVMVCHRLRKLKPGFPMDGQFVNLYLKMLLVFTDYTLWKFTAKAGDAMKPTLHKLCSSFIDHLVDNGFFTSMHELLLNGLSSTQPGLSKTSLPAAMGIRALALCQFPPKTMILFVRHILSVPACILHLHQLSPETLQQLEKVRFLSRVVEVLHSSKSADGPVAGLDGNSVLCIYANLVHLGSLHVKVIAEDKLVDRLLGVLVELVPQCSSKKASIHSSTSSWHPLLGWCSDSMDKRMLNCMAHVRKQLQLLWHGALVDYLFSPILALTPAPTQPPSAKGKGMFSLLPKKSTPSINIDKAALDQACGVCLMYNQCLQTLTQTATDILVGLGCNEILVSKMWYFVRGTLGLDADKVVQTLSSGAVHSLGAILTLFCQIAQYLIAILDDEELFVQQRHFTTADLVEMSAFFNRLVFRLVWDSPPSLSSSSEPLLGPCHTFLLLLYNRDSRRPFCEEGHWLIKELKISSFMSELKAKKPRALELLTKIPHAIPHRKRVEIFHQQIDEDRAKLGISRSHDFSTRRPATYITAHRGRILEDGYTQLALLPSNTLKGTVRVKFVNEQGLDEAGIDETGVFKEFLEETIKMAFDPGLNLFKANSAGHLYPSPTSHVQENHLSLFEFVGKMLGKAVYEGIVVDVPFAPFFLSQILEQHHSALYSSLDELPSLDPELYKSLTFIKHYDGDVDDLCLTFSWDEDFMGKVITHELVPGGCGIPVSIENRISYVHQMAHFRMRTQLKLQSSAFIQGFLSIVNRAWITCFSPQELQKLISGDHVELDVADLRKHTQYYGGYHDSHKVIRWLWDVIERDFSAEEKAGFLKFVTSCSKSPLLGFAHLQPPFSIRFVEVAEEEDRGDSLPSVLRGLFSVGRRGARDRLPTASTCFNLLKLPNYTKKSVLRDKLRYSILSNAGFELS